MSRAKPKPKPEIQLAINVVVDSDLKWSLTGPLAAALQSEERMAICETLFAIVSRRYPIRPIRYINSRSNCRSCDRKLGKFDLAFERLCRLCSIDRTPPSVDAFAVIAVSKSGVITAIEECDSRRVAEQIAFAWSKSRECTVEIRGPIEPIPRPQVA